MTFVLDGISEISRPIETTLVVESELDCACAEAVADQVRQSLNDGSDMVMVDLITARDVSLFGLAVLIYRISMEGNLRRVIFRSLDKQVNQQLAIFSCTRIGLQS